MKRLISPEEALMLLPQRTLNRLETDKQIILSEDVNLTLDLKTRQYYLEGEEGSINTIIDTRIKRENIIPFETKEQRAK